MVFTASLAFNAQHLSVAQRIKISQWIIYQDIYCISLSFRVVKRIYRFETNSTKVWE